jgi:hypothetical protein
MGAVLLLLLLFLYPSLRLLYRSCVVAAVVFVSYPAVAVQEDRGEFRCVADNGIHGRNDTKKTKLRVNCKYYSLSVSIAIWLKKRMLELNFGNCSVRIVRQT